MEKAPPTLFTENRVMIHPGADADTVKNLVVRDFNGHGRFVITADLDNYPINSTLLRRLISIWECSILQFNWDGSAKLTEIDHNKRDIVSIRTKRVANPLENR